MGRPVDWSPLAEADPVPGDPYEVAALGRRFRATADLIASASRRLATMCTDDFWDSDAGKAFRQRSVDTAGKLSKAYARYEAATHALGTDSGGSAWSTADRPDYASSLAEAQAMSVRALTAAQDAAAAQRTTMAQMQTYTVKSAPGSAMPGPSMSSTPGVAGTSTGTLLPYSLNPDSSRHLMPDLYDPPEVLALKRQYNTATDELTTARGQLASAEQIRDTAANYAAELINQTIDSDGIGDSLWDHFTNLIDEHAGLLSAISQIAGWVATVCGTLALVVGWIPVVGWALAAVLGTIALVASVVALISDVLLEIGGKGSWFDIALDVIAVASFGLGRAAIGALKDSTLLARLFGKAELFKSAESALMESDVWLKEGEDGLGEALPKAWETADKAVGETPKNELEEALAREAGRWPGWGRILRGFHPGAILKDGFTDIGDLNWSNWKELGKSATWKDAKFFVGDPEIHKALESLGRISVVADEPPVKAYLIKVATSHNMWRYVTIPAIASDFTNHILTETHLKDPFLYDVGLGWAAG
jgi:hypothetical protein